MIGAAQWLALRQFIPWISIAATSIGMAVGPSPLELLFRRYELRARTT